LFSDERGEGSEQKSPQPIDQSDFVKVQHRPESDAAEFEVSQKLGFVHRMEDADGPRVRCTSIAQPITGRIRIYQGHA
jgi:hypothetical protein